MISTKKKPTKKLKILSVTNQQTRIMHDAHDKTLINLMKLHTIFKKKHNFSALNLEVSKQYWVYYGAWAQ